MKDEKLPIPREASKFEMFSTRRPQDKHVPIINRHARRKRAALLGKRQ